jgi:hypothetical protein
VPLRVVPEIVGAKSHLLVPWQYPLTEPDLVLPPIVYVLKAAFKFNTGELDEGLAEELFPLPPHDANRTVDMRGKTSFKLVFFSTWETTVFDIIFLDLLFFI